MLLLIHCRTSFSYPIVKVVLICDGECLICDGEWLEFCLCPCYCPITSDNFSFHNISFGSAESGVQTLLDVILFSCSFWKAFVTFCCVENFPRRLTSSLLYLPQRSNSLVDFNGPMWFSTILQFQSHVILRIVKLVVKFLDEKSSQ